MTDSAMQDMIAQVVDGRGDESFKYCCCGEVFIGSAAIREHLKSQHAEEYVSKFKYLLRTGPVSLPTKEVVHAAVNRHKKKLEKAAKQRANRRSHRRIGPEGNGQRPIYTPMGNKR